VRACLYCAGGLRQEEDKRREKGVVIVQRMLRSVGKREGREGWGGDLMLLVKWSGR